MKIKSIKFCQCCFCKAKRGEYKKENHPHWKGGLPNCQKCGKKLSRTDAHLCNKCYFASRNKSPAVKCQQCDRILSNKKAKFCRKCYDKNREVKPHYCSSCYKKLSKYNFSIRCHSCENKRRIMTSEIKKKISESHKKLCLTGRKCYRWGKKAPHSSYLKYKSLYFHSSWEVAYAKYLNKNKVKWQYESKTFDLGNTTYTPDFYLPETNEYIEVKGWWRDDAKEKFNLFKKQYSHIKISIFDKLKLQSLKIL